MRGIENRTTPGDNTARNFTFHEHATIVYAAAINLTIESVNEQDVYVGLLTGNITVNLDAAGKAKLVKGDRVNIIFNADANARTITWGTNIKAPAATLVTIASGGNYVRGVYDGTNLILNQ